jgi:hypothetical protein
MGTGVGLQFREDGRLDVQSVNALGNDELRRWIRDRLHERDTRVPGSPKRDVGQYYLIGAIYEKLASSTKKAVRHILDQFLREMEKGHDDWTGRPAHSLLLLTKEIGEDDLAGPILRMAKQEQFLGGNEDEDLHARLLQTLTYLGVEATPDFWKRQLDLDASRFGIYAFSGMCLHSPYLVLGQVLPELNLEDDRLRAQLKLALPDLLDRDREDLHDAIKTLDLSEEERALIRDALPELWPDPLGYMRARSFLDKKNELQKGTLSPTGKLVPY